MTEVPVKGAGISVYRMSPDTVLEASIWSYTQLKWFDSSYWHGVMSLRYFPQRGTPSALSPVG